MTDKPQVFSWKRRVAPLPTESDFDPYNGCLDCQCAWKNFGNLSLDQAYALFIERPEIYQEDFMFMGPAAFFYYFPIVDRYMREVAYDENSCGTEADILGYAINYQFEGFRRSQIMLVEINSLASFVLANPDRYADDKDEKLKIINTWTKLHTELQKANNPHMATPRNPSD